MGVMTQLAQKRDPSPGRPHPHEDAVIGDLVNYGAEISLRQKPFIRELNPASRLYLDKSQPIPCGDDVKEMGAHLGRAGYPWCQVPS
jgi:hypothetical protein